MPKRKHNLRLHIMVSHKESSVIQERMAEVGSLNRSSFLRKMMLNRYVLKVNLESIKERIYLQRRCINNIAQIAKNAQDHNIYQDEIADWQKDYTDFWKGYSELLEHLAKLVTL